jgi:hypothetical protein
MKRTIVLADAKRMLRSRAELIDRGWRDRRIRAAVEEKTLVRVRRGWFVTREAWDGLWAEGRHLVEVAAAASDMAGGSHVFSHVSAAVLWGLPLFRLVPTRVHVTGSTVMKASNTLGVSRHEDRLPDEDVTAIDGILCTSLERTVLDVARFVSAEAAVAVADAALAVSTVRGHAYDEAEATRWREALTRRAVDGGAIRGIRQARRVIDFADGRAQLPGESVSRLQLVRLGFDKPRLQVPVAGPGGTTYWIDLGLDDVDAFGEFDGKTKYLDESQRSGLPLEEVLLREKQREDWVRGTTHRRLARWGDEHIGTPELLGARLESFGIRPHG